jgi:hypothetical protein
VLARSVAESDLGSIDLHIRSKKSPGRREPSRGRGAAPRAEDD